MGNALAACGIGAGKAVHPHVHGNACIFTASTIRQTVHPHVHGERYGSSGRADCVYGSSPRTWGTHNRRRRPIPRQRFIPTYMGNASIRRAMSNRCPVHPHVHGERIRCPLDRLRRSGSSPRTWGTLSHTEYVPLHRRFIPTYMGNADRKRCIHTLPTVHPHVHGERFTAPPDLG